MVLGAALFNNQHYKVRIKGNGIQGMESHPPLRIDVVAIEKGVFGSPSTKVINYYIETGAKKYLKMNNLYITIIKKTDSHQ